MNISKILITNNTDGNHSPDQWAMATSEMVAEATDLDGEKLVAAQKLQAKIAEVLVKHHGDVQRDEAEALKADPQHVHKAFHHALKADLNNIVAEIVKAAEGSQWEEHYKRKDVQQAVRAVVENHLHSSMHVERLCHADRNPKCQYAAAYKAMHHNGGAV